MDRKTSTVQQLNTTGSFHSSQLTAAQQHGANQKPTAPTVSLTLTNCQHCVVMFEKVNTYTVHGGKHADTMITIKKTHHN